MPDTGLTEGSARSQARASARFGRRPRILVLRFEYFLEREILAALACLDAEVRVFSPASEEEKTSAGYAQALLAATASFKPHFLLSVNLLGADPEGRMFEVMARLGVAWAIWLVDSPELFLHGAASPLPGRASFFCCDPDHAAKFAAMGLANSHALPLACDHTRFDLTAPVDLGPHPERDRFQVSFLGATWVEKLAACHRDFRFPAGVLRGFTAVARDLAEQAMDQMKGLATVGAGQATPQAASPVLAEFCADRHPGFWQQCLELDAPMRRGVLHLLCWEANRVYRLACVRTILPFAPLIAGDRHWVRALGDPAGRYLHHPPIAYYGTDLARFYRLARVNFCCSGVQMPRALTQRAFDIPASGALALLDYRDQLAECFEIGQEVACYRTLEEVPELVERYSRDRDAAKKIIEAGRKRIAAEHTYRHRLERMIGVMREG